MTIELDDPLMPAYLVAKDAHMLNGDEWKRQDEMPFGLYKATRPEPPNMPWIAVVQALDKAGMLRPVAESPTESETDV